MTDSSKPTSDLGATCPQRFKAKLDQLDEQLERIRAARDRVENAAQLLAEGDWGTEASAELRAALRALNEDRHNGE